MTEPAKEPSEASRQISRGRLTGVSPAFLCAAKRRASWAGFPWGLSSAFGKLTFSVFSLCHCFRLASFFQKCYFETFPLVLDSRVSEGVAGGPH